MPSLRFLSLLIFFIAGNIYCGLAQERTVSGMITDGQGNAVSFATVKIEELELTSIANENGFFTFSVAPGKYHVDFSYVGYKPRQVIIDLQTSISLNMVLNPEVMQLSEVKIRGSNEDPAYEMIRNVIANRKRFASEDSLFTYDSYTKGIQKVLKVPKTILGQDVARVLDLDENRQSIIYQSETSSKVYSRGKNKKEIIIASKVAGDNQGFSFNRALDLQVNFYNNSLSWDALGQLSFVSPIGDMALKYYQYKLVGTFNYNERTICKIQVIPNYKYDPVFSGYIYIVKDDWHLYSTDLILTEDARINFVDTMRINQQFSEIEKDVWKQSDMILRFKGKVLGFDFAGYFVGLNSNYQLNNPLPASLFSNEIVRIEPDANKKENAYWKENRPLPLSREEQINYFKQDSIAEIKQSKPYQDSLERVKNKFRLVTYVLAGYQHNNISNDSYWFIYPLHNTLFYNTVEGFGINFRARYNRQLSLRRSWQFTPNVRYGFASKTLNANAELIFRYDTLHNASVSLYGGSDYLDLNNRGTLNLFYNTLNTLFWGRNYLKLYRSNFLSLRTDREIIEGLQITTGVEVAKRFPATNLANKQFFDDAQKEFTSNNPLTPRAEVNLFPVNNSVTFELKAAYTFKQHYTMRPDGKLYEKPIYPTFQLDYRKGIEGAFNSVVDYDFLSLDIFQDKIRTGVKGFSAFYVSAGKFLNTNSIFFPDRHHFTGNQTAVYNPLFPNFHFLDYYAYSTSDKYFEAHYEHNFAGIWFSKIPLLRKLKLQEIVGGGYLTQPQNKYRELYVGVQRLMFRADFGFSWASHEPMHSAFRLFYGF